MNTLLNAEQVRMNVSMVRFLQCLGFIPAKRVGAELFYLSMLEESDIQFSFVVNEEYNRWYDHGWGIGGDLVEFVKFYWKPISHQDALIKIHATLGLPGSEHILHSQTVTAGTKDISLKSYSIISINEIGTTEALTVYLEKQQLRGKIAGDLKEIFFKKEYHGMMEDRESKLYFGIGWPNECGGWEIRNKYFRTCVGHKGVTFIPKSEDSLVVFSDYFSYLVWNGDLEREESVIVLNNHELIHAALSLGKPFKRMQLYLDRSQAGFKATRTFCRHFPGSIDRSINYSGHLNLHASVVTTLREHVSGKF